MNVEYWVILGFLLVCAYISNLIYQHRASKLLEKTISDFNEGQKNADDKNGIVKINLTKENSKFKVVIHCISFLVIVIFFIFLEY